MKTTTTKNFELQVTSKGTPVVYGLFRTDLAGVDGKTEDRTLLQGLFFSKEEAEAAIKEIDYDPKVYHNYIRKLKLGDYHFV